MQTMETNIPKTSDVFAALLRADLTTQWRNRRALILTILVPIIILISWKGLLTYFGSGFVLGNCITVGLMAIGLMGYSNAVARDREKGIFQRLRVAPVASWSIMGSRLMVQLLMIIIVTCGAFFTGINIDKITDISVQGYLVGFCMACVGGCVYLSLGQVIVGLIKNPETVNSTTRLVYFVFIMTGMFGELNKELPKIVKDIEHYSPYGTTKQIIMAGLHPATWTGDDTTCLLLTLGYTVVFTVIGIRKFVWR